MELDEDSSSDEEISQQFSKNPFAVPAIEYSMMNSNPFAVEFAVNPFVNNTAIMYDFQPLQIENPFMAPQVK